MHVLHDVALAPAQALDELWGVREGPGPALTVADLAAARRQDLINLGLHRGRQPLIGQIADEPRCVGVPRLGLMRCDNSEQRGKQEDREGLHGMVSA